MRAICQKPGKHIEAARRAFWIGHTGNARGQIEPLEQRHQIDAPRLQNSTLFERHFVHSQIGKPLGHGLAIPRQEAGAQPICLGPQAQIEARRLDLVIANRSFGPDFIHPDHGPHKMRRQKSGLMEHGMACNGHGLRAPLGGQWAPPPLAGGQSDLIAAVCRAPKARDFSTVALDFPTGQSVGITREPRELAASPQFVHRPFERSFRQRNRIAGRLTAKQNIPYVSGHDFRGDLCRPACGRGRPDLSGSGSLKGRGEHSEHVSPPFCVPPQRARSALNRLQGRGP